MPTESDRRESDDKASMSIPAETTMMRPYKTLAGQTPGVADHAQVEAEADAQHVRGDRGHDGHRGHEGGNHAELAEEVIEPRYRAGEIQRQRVKRRSRLIRFGPTIMTNSMMKNISNLKNVEYVIVHTACR